MPDEKHKNTRKYGKRKARPAAAGRRLSRSTGQSGSTTASGFAHNFNNLLTIIAGNLQMIDKKNADPSLKAPLGEALAACEIGARMVENLLTYSRQRQLDLKLHNADVLISGMSHLILRLAGENISVVFEHGLNLPRVLADKSEFENAILNLTLNARDAMANGGTLTIETAVSGANQWPAQNRSGRPMLVVSVIDTGAGMPAHVAARACEPFFTTKNPKLGTGLGLSTVEGFVKQLGGTVEIESSLGKGTAIRMFLPIAEAEN